MGEARRAGVGVSRPAADGLGGKVPLVQKWVTNNFVRLYFEPFIGSSVCYGVDQGAFPAGVPFPPR